MDEELRPAPHIYINDLDSLRVVSDSFRLQLLSLLDEPRTVKELAKSLDIPPHKLYYHINMLEEHGFIRVTSTRMVSAIPEKFYQITAFQFRTNPDLLTITTSDKSQAGLDIYLQSVLDTTKNDIKKSAEVGLLDFSATAPRWQRLLSMRGILRYPHAKAQLFQERFVQLLKDMEEEIKAEIEPQEETQAFEFTLVFFPTVAGATISEEQQKDE